jgi:hypothetical protein
MTSLPKIQKPCAIIGVVLLAMCVIYGCFFPALFFEGYLTAFIFWVEVALGCMGLLFIQYLTGGRWGMTITRLLEAGMMTLPFCAALFLPNLVGLTYLFPWVHPASLGSEVHHLVEEKSAYLNVPFYLLRYVIYFVVLSAFAVWFRRLSLRRDANNPIAFATMEKWSGPCLIVFVLLMNFASIDWVMSLNPEWYSSMLVVEFGAEQAVVAVAWCILVLRVIADVEPMRSALNTKVIHDVGNLLLGFTCLWTYVTFMEYIITWTGNLPHDVSWFSARSSAGWKIFAAVLVIVHFLIPMFCLIMTSISKNLVRLSYVAALMIAAHFLQVVWWVEPGFAADFHITWTSLILIPALGAIWIAAYIYYLGAVPLLPGNLELPKKERVA